MRCRIMKNPLKGFTAFDYSLWGVSAATIITAFLLTEPRDYINLATSLVGVTALIFIAKGRVLGQILTVVFAALYGVVSYFFRYYGEMITYLGMTAPIAIVTVIDWLRHPFKDSAEVSVGKVSKKQLVLMSVLSIAVTAAFGALLYYLNTPNLVVSIISITTSFVASYLSLLRSPYYAAAYAANDVVLIVLWILAAVKTPSYAPMIACFAAFLLNDVYGLISWRKMKKRQEKTAV